MYFLYCTLSYFIIVSKIKIKIKFNATFVLYNWTFSSNDVSCSVIIL